MKHTALTMLTASMLVTAVVGIPSSARSQVVVIIGNGSAQPYYPNPYPYPYQPRVYAERTLYGDPGYDGYADSGYYQSYYNGYYRPYRYGYYQPNRYWGYRGW
jgi:hypothetical protein